MIGPAALATRVVAAASILLLTGAAHAGGSDRERPIILTLHTGVLRSSGMLDIEDGAHPSFLVSLAAEPHPNIGYSLDLALTRAGATPDAFTARAFSAGPVVAYPVGPFRLRYRAAYGVVFTRGRRSTLFEHGPSAVWTTGSRLRLMVDLRHIIPNDWVQQIRLDEDYGTVAVAFGMGVAL